MSDDSCHESSRILSGRKDAAYGKYNYVKDLPASIKFLLASK